MVEEKKEEKIWKGSIGLLLGKEYYEYVFVLLLLFLFILVLFFIVFMMVVSSVYVKMGSKDSSI